MITVDVDVHAAASLRWAVSPVVETVSWLRLAKNGGVDPVYGAPTNVSRDLLADPDVALVADLLPETQLGVIPDFLTPAPTGRSTAEAAGGQFDEVAATSGDLVARQLDDVARERCLPDDVVRAVDDGTLAVRAARGLKVFWEQGVSEVFAPVDLALREEIDRCARLLARDGLRGVLNTVHPGVSWTGEALQVYCACEHRGALCSDFLLVPTALFGSTSLAVQMWGEHPYLGYPIGGGRPAPRVDLLRLLGATRARILGCLMAAQTTTGLSRELHLSAGTVSYHVTAMHRAGLLTRSRDGHSVRYEITGAGRKLLVQSQ